MAHLAASMVDTVNHHCWDNAITMGEHSCLSTECLKIPLPLSHKLAACFIGLFTVLHTIDPFCVQLQFVDVWAIHNMFHARNSKPAVGIVGAFDTPFYPEANDSWEFQVQDILDSHSIFLHG